MASKEINTMSMKITKIEVNTDILQEYLEVTKPIWKDIGTIQNSDWVTFHEGRVYSFNGYFQAVADTDISETFSLPGKQAHLMVKKYKGETVTILIGDSFSGLITGKATAQFSYPFNVKEHLNHFSECEATFSPCSNLKEGMSFCFNTTFKDNIQYSNVYLFNNRLYATDGYRISTAEVQGQPTSLPKGLDALIYDEPSEMAVDSAVHFRVDKWLFSARLYAANPDCIVQYVPEKDIEQIINFPEGTLDILSTAKKFDSEMKIKDLYVNVTIENNRMLFEIQGMKAKFREEIHCEYTDRAIKFKVHPSYLEYALTLSPMLRLSPEVSYVQIKKDDKNYYLWVEYLD